MLFGLNQGSPPSSLELPASLSEASEADSFDLKTCSFKAASEQLRPARVTRVGLIQNMVPVEPTAPFGAQREGLHARIEQLLEHAATAGVQVACLQEAWPMPFAFCTRERTWCEFAEPATLEGPTTRLIAQIARRHRMVIVSPILERDEQHGGVIWNTAVVLGPDGQILGKHRKNHIPRVSPFDEANYYREGDTGHPVFDTPYGKIAINICYGRHIPLNWLGFALNGAEIVFNPSATVGALAEPLWSVEGRNAAIANSYYVCSINRVGTETFPNEFSIGDGKPAGKSLGPFFGSSYVAAPDASRSPSLARHKDGLLVADLDLNLCRQTADRWGFRMTARYPLYAKLLSNYIKPGYEPQIIPMNAATKAIVDAENRPGVDGE